jgi:esterase/lipase
MSSLSIMQKLQEMNEHNTQDELKQYQDTTNKRLEKIQKELNELKEDFNKLQVETKETIKNRDI